MTITFIFMLPPGWLGALLGIVAVWLVISIYKYIASLVVGG